MRIFHGLYNIAGIPSVMARAERALGADSTSVCFPAANPGYLSDLVEEPGDQPGDHSRRFERYAFAYDIFVFHFGYSLALDALADVPLLKAMGKTVVFYFHGCDIRQSKETIRKYRFSACRECWPQRCNSNRDLALVTATRYADAIWVSTPDLLEFVPGSVLFPQPLDVRSTVFQPKDHGEASQQRGIRIVHAPSDRALKGTKYLVSAADSLRAEGVEVELDLVENVPHDRVFVRSRSADFSVDQLVAGSYGMFTLEMMVIGVPVICFLREDLIAKYPQPPPIVNADPSTIASVIRDVITRRAEWPAIARAARAYVERVHDAQVLARKSLEIYRALTAVRLGRPTTSGASVVPRSAPRQIGKTA
jgi:glycosyltransferase involved in cell wall biosynthesis